MQVVIQARILLSNHLYDLLRHLIGSVYLFEPVGVFEVLLLLQV